MSSKSIISEFQVPLKGGGGSFPIVDSTTFLQLFYILQPNIYKWPETHLEIYHFKLKLKNGVPAPTTPDALRKVVISTIPNHPQVSNWLKGAFQKRKKDFNNFVKNQFISCTFMDVHAIVVTCIAEYLNVLYNIVTNSEESNVSYFIMPDYDIGPDDGRQTLWIYNKLF